MDVNAPRGALRYFADMEDPRDNQGKRHKLLDMIVIAICAVICGADGWSQVAQFGRCKRKWFKTFLDLPHGIPSHMTFGRVFALLDPDAFERRFLSWAVQLGIASDGRLIAIDGKTIRGSLDTAAQKSAFHMVSAWCSTNSLVLGQIITADKSNEITAIPELLELVDVAGAVVTTDAMGCQKAIAAKIIDGGGDYLLAVKDNHKTLHEELQELFGQCMRKDCHGVEFAYAQDVDKGHGRVETRRCWVTPEVKWFAERDQWKGLRSFVCVESVREVGDKRSVERRYYVGSVDATDAARTLRYTREHWGVENGLHWRLDVAFDEDRRRIRKGHGAENFSRLSRIALNLLMAEQSEKRSIKTKRLVAGWDHDYLLHLLLQEPRM
jgi:predicted transposase YbfD/YdcC